MRTLAAPWLFSAVAALPALRAQDDVATEAVKKLADPGTREAAHKQLLALGAAALPALEVAIGDADVEFMSAALSVLDELGPVAGRSMQRVLDVYCSSVLRGPRTLATLVELAPWRPDDGTLDWLQIESASRVGSKPDDCEVDQWYRLRARCMFPRDADLPTLMGAMRSRNAWRAEIAIQLLGSRGPAAAAALPALQMVLERPEPRMPPAGEVVPLHRRAAVAVLAMSPPRALAELARERLAGRGPAPAALPEVPARLRTRIDELITDLGDPAKRAAAVTNLQAIGEVAAPQLAASITRKAGSDAIAAVIEVLTALGRQAAAATPGLIAALPAVPVEHAAAALRALAIMAPWWYGEVYPIRERFGNTGVELDGKWLEGAVDDKARVEIAEAARVLAAAVGIDPEATITELRKLLASDDVFVRERSLALLQERGRDAAAALPAIASLLRPPLRRQVVFGKDGTAMVQRAAARAIVAIAAPEDPLVTEARELLGESPK